MPVLPVADVTVSGARHVTEATAVAQSGIALTPIFQVRTVEARDALRRVPAIRDAQIELSLPDRAHIRVTEREPVARWASGREEWLVDAEGVLFTSAQPALAPAPRILDERRVAYPPGARIDAVLLAAALRLARIAPGELRADARQLSVRIADGPDGLVLRAVDAGWEIRFGDATRMDEKLRNARAFLQTTGMRRLDYVDVRTPDHIVSSP